MIIQPRIRGFICTTAHPGGCAQHVQDQIDYVRSKGIQSDGPKRVLVIGASTGFGLASRIVAAFGYGAETIGVFFEKESDGKKTATAGWYNSVAFEQKAQEQGLYAKSFNGDAFSDEMKRRVVAAVEKDWGSVDLVIYSLASPRRENPRTGKVSRSVLKPIGKSFSSKTLNLNTTQLEDVTIEPAQDDDVEQTVAVMGGEDWEWWIDALEKENLLAEGAMTVAYSYVGPKITQLVYRNGTIGKAKLHLEETAKNLDARLRKLNGRAFVSVNKALVTQSSSAIPVIPLYFVLLKKVMKEKGIEEDCIAQMTRLFRSRLYAQGEVPVDGDGLIRMDDWEVRADVQAEVQKHWDVLTSENLGEFADIEGYNKDFLRLFGFGLSGVDYNADANPVAHLLSDSR